MLLQGLTRRWIGPMCWVKFLGTGEEVLIMVHYPRTHANNGLVMFVS